MNELPIVLISKELKYLLALEKVKTLEKAIEIKDTLTDENKKEAITNVEKKFEKIKEKVKKEFRAEHRQVKGESTQSLQLLGNVKSTQEVVSFLLCPTLCEIYGGKGCGKTCLLLHYGQQFVKMHKGKNGGVPVKVRLINCTSGMTERRLARLSDLEEEGLCSVEYFDMSAIEDIITFCKSLLDRALPTCPSIILIDSMISLLLPHQKAKPLVCRIFNMLQQLYMQGHSILFTNLLQHKYELSSEDLYNHASYHSQYHGEFLTHKVYVERGSKTSHVFRGAYLKGRFKPFQWTITEEGIQHLQWEEQVITE